MSDSFKTLLDQVRSNWHILLFFGGFVYSYSDIKNSIKRQEERGNDMMKLMLDFGNSGAQIKRDVSDLKAGQAVQSALQQADHEIIQDYLLKPNANKK